MGVIDDVGLCIAVLSISISFVLYLCDTVLPCTLIPPLSALLDETKQLLHHAEVAGAVSLQSEHRTQLDQYEDPFIHSPSSHAALT